MSKDLLFCKFKYDLNNSETKRQQSLRNAYILYGFDALRIKIKKIPGDEFIKSSDISFLNKEEHRLS